MLNSTYIACSEWNICDVLKCKIPFKSASVRNILESKENISIWILEILIHNTYYHYTSQQSNKIAVFYFIYFFNIHLEGADIVAQQAKPQHRGAGISSGHWLLYLLSNSAHGLRKKVEDGPNPWDPAHTWATKRNVLGPSFGTTQDQLLAAILGVGQTSRWKILCRICLSNKTRYFERWDFWTDICLYAHLHEESFYNFLCRRYCPCVFGTFVLYYNLPRARA